MRNLYRSGLLLTLFISYTLAAQDKFPARLRVFIDCTNTWCDMDFIRTEINLVDFLLDRQASDVHVLITEQDTGGGGDEFQLIFFGQNQFRSMTDTIRFHTDPNATQFEERELLIKYLKLGLAPLVAKTKMAKDVLIQMRTKDGVKTFEKDSALHPTLDPWNYWVFRIGTNGHLDADEVYKNSRISANFSANRITDKLKIGFEIYGGKNKSIYQIEDSNGIQEKIVIRNDDYNFNHSLVRSLGDQWSWGYETGFSRSSFSNNKSRLIFRSGIEYAIFPYKEVNTKFFTLSYIGDIRRNFYFDTTLYDKTNETLLGHALKANLSYKQKWGTISFVANYHNYLHNWKFFNLGVSTDVEIRITGGLSFNIYTSAELTRDQLFLPKEGATTQEVLTRRRQLASGYRIFTYFGINYRFGSKLNNFVNPRFN